MTSRQKSAVERCLYCGSDDLVIRVRGDDYGMPAVQSYACTAADHGRFEAVVGCQGCGLMTIRPWPDRQKLAAYYSEVVDKTYAALESFRRRTYSRALGKLARAGFDWRPGTRVFEVGCYTGVFLDEARRRGWTVSGCEPSRWAFERASGRLGNGVVHNLSVEELEPRAVGAVDVVFMWDVIEHLYTPWRELERVAEFLRPGAWLVLTTMRSDAMIARLLGRRWPWIMPMHLWYFTRSTLNRLLSAAGFEARLFTTYSHVVSLGYVLDKLAAMLGRTPKGAVRPGPIAEIPLPVNLGDFMLVVAERAPR